MFSRYFRWALLSFAALMISQNGFASLSDLNCRYPRFELGSSSSCRAYVPSLSLCLSRALWTEYLNSVENRSFCGSMQGHWKLSAHPELYPAPDTPKPEIHRFLLERLPDPPTAEATAWASFSWTDALWRRLQRKREQISEWLSAHDPWGIARGLLLGETNAAAPPSFLQLLGFLRFSHATGIHFLGLFVTVQWTIQWVIRRASRSITRIQATHVLWMERLLITLFCIWAWLLEGCHLRLMKALILFLGREALQGQGVRPIRGSLLFSSLLLETFAAFWSGHPILTFARLKSALSMCAFLWATQERSLLKRLFQGELASWLVIAPLQLARGEPLAVLTPLLSGLSFPWICVCLYPSLICSTIFSSLRAPLQQLLSGFQWVLQWAVNLVLMLPSVWIVSKGALAMAAAFSVFLMFRPQRLFSLLVLAALIRGGFFIYEDFQVPQSAAADEIVQLDVGQGDSALVLTGTSAGLIDAGSAWSLSDADWIRIFSFYGVTEIDWIALTHLDQDHQGGLRHLSRLLPIRCVASSSAEMHSARGVLLAENLWNRGIQPFSWVGADSHLTPENNRCAPFPIWAPSHSMANVSLKSANSNMSGILVPLRSGRVYISAGDADQEAEVVIARWADSLAQRLPRRVLKISHHGSKTSSAPETLSLIHPEKAIISVGLGNSYGHPSPEVLDRLKQSQIPVRRTDQTGPEIIR